MWFQVPKTTSHEIPQALEPLQGEIADSGVPIPAARPASLALSSRHMSRHTLRAAAVTTALIPFTIALSIVPTSGGQSSMPRALDAKDPITYFIAEGSGQTGYRSSDRDRAARQRRHASARQHRLFNVSARTRPRAGVSTHA